MYSRHGPDYSFLSKRIINVSVTKGREIEVKFIFDIITNISDRGNITRFCLLNRLYFPTGNSLNIHVLDHFIIPFQGFNILLHLLLSIAELLYRSIMFLFMPIYILLGLIRGQKCVTVLTAVILIPALWITISVTKYTEALDDMVYSGLIS